MATLADALRGYVPPTDSPMSDVVTNYASNIIPQAQQNLQNQTNNIQNALTMTPDYHIQVGNQQAFNEFMNQVPNQAGMMIGPESKLWNQENAFKAAQMLKSGIPAEDVWKATGTAKGLENAFRQEISDEPALLKGIGNFGEIYEHRKAMHGVTTPTVEEVMRHPELFEAYPQLKGIQVQLLPETSKTNASYSPVEGIIRVNPKLTSEKALSSMLHELQHGIQETEGWNKGADANTILKNYQQQLDDVDTRLTEANRKLKNASGTPEYESLMKIRDEISKEYRNLTGSDILGIYGKAMDEYKAHGGEAEARLTQRRQKLTPEQRVEIYPFSMGKNALDINPDNAIIKMEHNSPTVTRREMLEKLLSKD